PGAPATFNEFKAKIREQFEKFNIVYAVKSGGLFDADMEERMLKGYESNTIPKIDTLEFKTLIDEGKIQVLGELMLMFNGLTIADPDFAPYLKICEREGIPIALHTGQGPPNIYKYYPKFRLNLGDPLLIDEVLIKYPKLKIYLMHAGIPFYENTLALMEQYPQVYCDLGAVLWIKKGLSPSHLEDFLMKAKEYGFIDRIMFGSDVMYWASRIEQSIQKLESFEFLNEVDKRKIFYENAITFFELNDLKN
ncbi:MAG: amidohydrolase family protein, partial [Flavobacteriaceae bacterium]